MSSLIMYVQREVQAGCSEDNYAHGSEDSAFIQVQSNGATAAYPLLITKPQKTRHPTMSTLGVLNVPWEPDLSSACTGTKQTGNNLYFS